MVEALRLALSVTMAYFFLTMIIDPLTKWGANCLVGLFKTDKGFIRNVLYLGIRMLFFLLIVFTLINTVLLITDAQDFAKAVGLNPFARKGRVVMRIPAPQLESKIILIDPKVLVRTIGEKSFFSISFRFKITKGDKEDPFVLRGGRFVVQAIIQDKVVETALVSLSEEFNVANREITGEYVSPQPFSLKQTPDYIELIWEMDKTDGTKLASLLYRITPH